MTERTVKKLLVESFTNNVGLLSGRTGLAIVFFCWARHSGDKRYAVFAGELLDEVFEEINAGTPLCFRDGLCGIGWGVDYLIRNGFIDGDADDILEELDAIVAGIETRDRTDDSFETGSAGIEFYRTSRRYKIPTPLPYGTVFRYGDVEFPAENILVTDVTQIKTQINHEPT